MNILEFPNPTKHANEAAALATRRAVEQGYCPMLVREFARAARKESSLWERPEHTALRVVPSKQARNRDSRSIA